MRASYIASQNITQAIPIFLLFCIFIFVAGALYVTISVLPGKSIPLLAGLVAGTIILTAVLAWQPKLAVPLIIVSVFFSPDIVLAQIPGRNVNLRMEDGVLLAALLALVIRYAAGREVISILRTPLDKPILAYCAVGLLSTLLGMYLGNVSPLRGFFFFAKRVEFFVLFYLLYYLLEGKRDIRIALYSIVVSALFVSAYNVYARVTTPVELQTMRAYTLTGASAPAVEYAEMLVILIPVIIAIAFETRKTLHIAAAIVISLFMVYLLLDSLRRSAFIGLAVAVLFLTLSRYRRLLIPVVGVILYFVARAPQNITRRMAFLWTELTQYPQPGGSLPDRIAGIGSAVRGFLYHPLIGRGLGTYRLSSVIAHNQYALFLSEIGAIGLAAFLWFIFSVGRLCWRGIKETTDNLHRAFCVGFLAGLLGWLVMNLATISFTSIRPMGFFMLMMAILVSCVRKDDPVEL